MATFLFLMLGVIQLIRDLRQLHQLRSQSFVVRRFRGLCVLVSDDVRVPLSFYLPWQRYVLIPSELLAAPYLQRMAILHEIQHHRQGDTFWVYILWLFRTVFYPNPLIHVWNKWISRVQEFACDETLVDQRKVDSHVYACGLLKIAQTTVGLKPQPACATGLVFWTDRNILKRRINEMFTDRKKIKGWRMAVALGLTLVGLMTATAYASQGLIRDRRVTLAQAQDMAKKSERGGEFPIVVNDLVLKWLNYFIGTPEGREKARAALARMELYKPMIERKIEYYRAPDELLAVPLIESGYQNLPPHRNPVRAAGLWQFIAPTARVFGLRVDEAVDERLNPELSTDSALRYLLSNRLELNDWYLAALAYNAGENAVQKAITQVGSRDAWTLVRSGELMEETNNYLPKLLAAILIMRNPSSVE